MSGKSKPPRLLAAPTQMCAERDSAGFRLKQGSELWPTSNGHDRSKARRADLGQGRNDRAEGVNSGFKRRVISKKKHSA